MSYLKNLIEKEQNRRSQPMSYCPPMQEHDAAFAAAELIEKGKLTSVEGFEWAKFLMQKKYSPSKKKFLLEEIECVLAEFQAERIANEKLESSQDQNSVSPEVLKAISDFQEWRSEMADDDSFDSSQLPWLTGSNKQVNWAHSIRADAVNKFLDEASDLPLEVIERRINLFRNELRAGFWIAKHKEGVL